MRLQANILRAIALTAGMAATATSAQSDPKGVWIDHTGRGAVEIADCGGSLCGHVVWIKDAKNKQACRTQIIGNARPVGSNTWDRGWIIDPDDNARYSVELKPVGEDRLRVTGYMGSKLFSETMMWKRAPADLKRCDMKEPVVPAALPEAPPAIVAPPSVAAPSPAQRIEPIEPPARPLPPPQQAREAAAPPVVTPEPEPRTAEADPQPEPERRTQRQANAKRKSGSNQCTLELPYITLKYPCDAF